jgi:hypothetical protein
MPVHKGTQPVKSLNLRKETAGYWPTKSPWSLMFDYTADAELYPQRSRNRPKQIAYHRFASAADAIQFAMEVLPPALLPGTFLEVNDERLGASQIRQLYEDVGFPLTRKRGKA